MKWLFARESRVLLSAIGTIIATIIVALLGAVYIDTTTLPPMGSFYNANDLGWISALRALSAVTVGTCMYAMMWVTGADALHQTSPTLRMRMVVMAILFAVSGSWAYTNLGLVLWGGFWHLIGLGFSMLTSAFAILAAYTYVKTRDKMLTMEEQKDD